MKNALNFLRHEDTPSIPTPILAVKLIECADEMARLIRLNKEKAMLLRIIRKCCEGKESIRCDQLISLLDGSNEGANLKAPQTQTVIKKGNIEYIDHRTEETE